MFTQSNIGIFILNPLVEKFKDMPSNQVRIKTDVTLSTRMIFPIQ